MSISPASPVGSYPWSTQSIYGTNSERELEPLIQTHLWIPGTLGRDQRRELTRDPRGPVPGLTLCGGPLLSTPTHLRRGKPCPQSGTNYPIIEILYLTLRIIKNRNSFSLHNNTININNRFRNIHSSVILTIHL